MDWTEEIPDYQKGEGTIKNIKLEKYEFKFENVSFKYPGHDKFILKNLNLTIEAGSKLAIVGINGAGKTTLTKLLMRLYEPTEGRILLNGVDIKQFDRESYFNIFAPVFQNIEIFAFPVWQNISMKPENETDRNRVMETLKRSDLEEKINRYETKLTLHFLELLTLKVWIFPVEKDKDLLWQEHYTVTGRYLYLMNLRQHLMHLQKIRCIRNLTKW